MAFSSLFTGSDFAAFSGAIIVTVPFSLSFFFTLYTSLSACHVYLRPPIKRVTVTVQHTFTISLANIQCVQTNIL